LHAPSRLSAGRACEVYSAHHGVNWSLLQKNGRQLHFVEGAKINTINDLLPISAENCQYLLENNSVTRETKVTQESPGELLPIVRQFIFKPFRLLRVLIHVE